MVNRTARYNRRWANPREGQRPCPMSPASWVRLNRAIRLLPESSCRWSMRNCESWPLRRWPRRSLGRRCRPQRWCTRPICNWWGTRPTSIGTAGAISWRSGRGDAAHPAQSRAQKAAEKRGADWDRLTLEAIAVPGGVDPSEFMALNDLFDQLAAMDAQAGEIAKLRIFAGLTVPEIAAALNLGRRTVDRQWAFARAWLRTQVSAG